MAEQSKKKCKKAGRNKKRGLHLQMMAERRKIRRIAQSNIPHPARLRHCGVNMEQLSMPQREMHGVVHSAFACRVCKKVKWIAPNKKDTPLNADLRWKAAKDFFNTHRRLHVSKAA